MNSCPRYEVDGERAYLRECSWGDEWRVLMPIGYRVTTQCAAGREPITLNVWDGERWQTQMWWWNGYIGDMP